MVKSLFSIAAFTAFVLAINGPLSAGQVDFNRDVLPILSDKCFACHGPDEEKREAGLRLDTFEGATADLGEYAAVVPNDANKSVLIARIDDHDDPMPPPESNLTLSVSEKAVLRAWVEAGAAYTQHWAFVAPTRPNIPTGVAAGANPIDAFIGRRLRDEALNFSPEASPQRLIRRVSLDLTGLPPTIDEVDAFVEAYASKGDIAYHQLVDRLIDSPRYGETMALPWLDAARYADTDGYQYDGPRFQWRWRDWVIDAYNSKMSFDQFTIEQLAGDFLPDATIDQIIATGFNRNHRYNSESGLVVEEFLLENAVDRVDTTSTLWMGLTMGCARCHDHKYDPFSQKDYYQLIAFFNSVPEAGRAIKSGNSEPLMIAPTHQQRAELAAKKQALAEAKAALTPGENPQQGGILIDRKVAHRYKLDAKPEHAVLKGSPAFKDGALRLDGESTVEISGQKKSVSLRANTPFSISFWLRAEKLGDSVIVSRQKPGTSRPGVELALVDGGRLRFDLITRWVAGTGRVTTRLPLQAGQWVHVTVTNDGSQSANGQRIYLDGKLVETEVGYNTNSNVGGVDEKRPLIIGGGIRPRSNKFVGAIRELRIYQSALWPEEIEILAATYGGPERKRFSRIKMTPGYADYVKLREELESFRKSLPTVMVMRETPQPKPTLIRKRGVYNSYGERVQRDVPSAFPTMDDGSPRNRLGLAKWLVSPEHPLTARVAVNRYWQKYFGTGLVKTAEDFGVQGDPPSHPELLEWLATEFIRSGWDIATMQKLIVTSRTYRQQSRVTEQLLRKDPENRLLARGPRLRLTGHAIRDQALFVSGLLSERIGGPSVSPYQPANLWAEMSMGMKYRQSKGEDLYRRSLYTIWKRTVAPPSMAVLDAADREACWVKRKQTNTPLQALTLLNETAFVESARHFAARMLREGGSDPVAYGFRTVTSRYPKPAERALLVSALREYRQEFAVRPQQADDLTSIGASRQNDHHDQVELAAYTALANVLLNLDETITRE